MPRDNSTILLLASGNPKTINEDMHTLLEIWFFFVDLNFDDLNNAGTGCVVLRFPWSPGSSVRKSGNCETFVRTKVSKISPSHLKRTIEPPTSWSTLLGYHTHPSTTMYS